MKLSFLFLILFTSLLEISFSQSPKSFLYNENGQLFLDTTLKISQEQLNKWIKGEKYFLYNIFDNIKYSPLARDAGLTGLVIISFECDSSSQIKNFKVVKKIGGGLEESVIEGIKKTEKQITNYLRNKFGSSESYFLPVIFELHDMSKEIQKNKAFMIKNYMTTLIENTISCPVGRLKE